MKDSQIHLHPKKLETCKHWKINISSFTIECTHIHNSIASQGSIVYVLKTCNLTLQTSNLILNYITYLQWVQPFTCQYDLACCLLNLGLHLPTAYLQYVIYPNYNYSALEKYVHTLTCVWKLQCWTWTNMFKTGRGKYCVVAVN